MELSTERINHMTSTVGVDPVEVAQQDPNRVVLLFVNMSANTIYLSPQKDVSPTRGIFVDANGGFVLLKKEEDFSLCTNRLWAVGVAPALEIYVLEVIRLKEG